MRKKTSRKGFTIVEPENTVLVILPGTYEGTVRAFTKALLW